MKNAMKLGICSCKAPGEKGAKFVVKNLGTFEFSFARKEEQQNFSRNFTAFSMATSTRGFIDSGIAENLANRVEFTLRIGKGVICDFGALKPQGQVGGGVSNGGVSRSGLICPFSSLFVLLGRFS